MVCYVRISVSSGGDVMRWGNIIGVVVCVVVWFDFVNGYWYSVWGNIFVKFDRSVYYKVGGGRGCVFVDMLFVI